MEVCHVLLKSSGKLIYEFNPDQNALFSASSVLPRLLVLF